MPNARDAFVGLFRRAARYAEEGLSAGAFQSAESLGRDIEQRKRDAQALTALADSYAKTGKAETDA